MLRGVWINNLSDSELLVLKILPAKQEKRFKSHLQTSYGETQYCSGFASC